MSIAGVRNERPTDSNCYVEVSARALSCVSESRKENEMKKQLLMIGGSAIMMAMAAFAGVGSAEGAAAWHQDVV